MDPHRRLVPDPGAGTPAPGQERAEPEAQDPPPSSSGARIPEDTLSALRALAGDDERQAIPPVDTDGVPASAARVTLPDGIARVYHYHVRKTAGTSVSSAFWSLAGLDSAAMIRAGQHVSREGLVFMRDNLAGIERGQWFFAVCHAAAHQIRLPPATFTVTVLRDPLRRLVSYYQYLHYLHETGQGDGTFPEERARAAGGFGDFVERLPRRSLLTQLFMFSRTYAVPEAVERARHVDAVLFTEQLPAGLAALGRRLGLELPERHERRFPHLVTIPADELAAAGAVLGPEQDFVESVRRARAGEPVVTHRGAR